MGREERDVGGLQMKSKNILAGVAVAAAFTAFAYGANAATITGLYNTGVDDSNAVVTGNAADLHWMLNDGPTYTGAVNSQFPIGYWVPDNSVSRWITPTPTASDSFDPSVDGTYIYTLTFNLTSATAAAFTGQFASDNTVTSAKLNGNLIGSGGSYGGWTNMAATASDFIVGQNTLVFTVDNFAQNGGNPAGLNVEFLSSTSGTPEPTTWALMMIGLAGMGMALRGSRKSMAMTAA
jgi:hypothetical protein